MYKAHLDLLVGPMFSGKTTELIRKIRRFQIARRRCVVLKWSEDKRNFEENNMVRTHDGTEILCIRVSNKLMDCVDRIRTYHVIGIDDGQFFPDIVEFVEEMVNNHKKVVIVSALDGNYKREPFNNICQLVPRAEKVKKFKAICTSCHSEASFSSKKIEGSDIIDIGGSEKYEALCRACFLEKNTD